MLLLKSVTADTVVALVVVVCKGVVLVDLVVVLPVPQSASRV